MASRHPTVTAAAATLAVAAAALTGCAQPARVRQVHTASSTPPVAAAVIATARQTLTVYRSSGSRLLERLSARTTFGSPRVLLVTATRPGWVQALLPQRPNGATGWVPTSQVQLSQTTYRIQVSLRNHRLTVLHGADVELQTKIATGASATPTPRGTFYVTDLVQVPRDQAAYGPYAFALSGYSPTLRSFDGGDAELALHGTNEPWLLGTSASHGCIRMSNAAIAELAQVLPLGTPVIID